jgi:hypothetical protein
MPANNRCFVIGPMNPGHMPKLEWLARKVVQPILQPHGYTVFTPDADDPGNIMHHVIKSCDRAQLVVADLTGNNPNVLYEMAILDAMGRACVPVKIEEEGEDGEPEEDKPPFDRAAYRYFPIPHDTKEAKKKLKGPLTEALKIRERGDLFQNPLTDYFEVPLSSFSSAFALARGYFYNLIKPVVSAVTDDDWTKGPTVLECVIPQDLDRSSRGSVEKLVKSGAIVPEVLKAKGRDVKVYSWPNEKSLVLMDIPTTMCALAETVRRRLGKGANPNPQGQDYLEVQADEVEQFGRYLKGFIDREHADGFEVRERVKLVPWAESRLAQA